MKRRTSRRATVDGGYAWVVLVSVFFCHLLQHGIAWTVGVFYVIFLENLEYDTPSQVATGMSLINGLMCGIGPVAGVMVNALGCRVVGMIGGALAGAGLIFTTFSRSVHLMCAMFGFVSGAGIGMSLVSSVITLTWYFERYRAIAFGVATSGVGLSTLVYPPLIRYLYEEYGWQGALLILGALSLNLVVFAATFRENSLQRKRRSTRNSDVTKKPSLLNMRMFANRSYIILSVNSFLLCVGFSAVSVHLAAYAESHGVDKHKSALLFSVSGITNFFGRLLFGALNQVPAFSALRLYTFGFMTAGIGTMLLPLTDTYLGMQIYAGTYGFFTSCFGSMIPQILLAFLGPALVTNSYGNLLLFEAIGMIAGGPLGSVMYEMTRVYGISFYMAGGSMALASALMLIPMIWPVAKSRYDDEENQTEVTT